MEVKTLWQNLSAKTCNESCVPFCNDCKQRHITVCKSLISPEYAARYRSLYYASQTSQNRSGALKRANNAINEEIEEGKTKQLRY